MIPTPMTANVIHMDPLPDDGALVASLAADGAAVTSAAVDIIGSADAAAEVADEGASPLRSASAMSTVGEHSVAG